MNKRTPILVALSALLATATFVNCSDDAGESGSEPALTPDQLFEQGPNAVGYRQLSLTYRPDGSDDDRTLPLEVWYPATAGTGEATTYRVAGIVEVEQAGVLTGGDAAPEGSWPVLVYSHGNGGVGLVGFSYGEYFASWGWLVVAPDHTGNTVIDPTNPFAFDLLTRPQDVSAVLDWLQSGVPEPLAGRASDEVLAVGHSFGGYSVLSAAGARSDGADGAASCEASDDGSCEVYDNPDVLVAFEAGFADARIDAIVPQAAGIGTYLDGELAALELPAMWMTARLDATVTWDGNGEPGWSLLDGPDDVWVDLVQGGHFSFIAACDVVDVAVLESIGQNVTTDGCGDDFTPISEIMPVLHAYVHAFGRKHVLGERGWDDVIAGPVLHADVVVTTR